MRILCGLLVISLVLPAPVHAFKVDTHTWLAEHIWRELHANQGEVTVGLLPGEPLERVKLPAHVWESIRRYKQQFIIGTMGADLYPDMVAGQMTTHPGLAMNFNRASVHEDLEPLLNLVGQSFLNTGAPGWQTDDWLKHVRDEALSLRARQGRQATPEIAFAMGYLLHAAMDTWAHSYVNAYSGDIFSIASNQKAAARHVVLESFINHLHEPFFEPEPARTGQKRAQRELGRVAVAPGRLAAKPTDALSSLKAPATFVRNTLILNDLAATQYAREKGALHIWAMWFWWQYSKQVVAQIDQTKTALSTQTQQAINAVTAYSPVWSAANTAKNQAAEAFGALDQQRSQLESNLISATTQFNAAQTALLAGIAGNPVIQGALDLANGLIDQVLGMITAGPLLPLKQSFISARNNMNKIKADLTPVIAAWRNARDHRDRMAQDFERKTREFDLRKATRDALTNMNTAGWRVVDDLGRSWTRNIELGVEAYTRAWEETIREIVRPQHSRFQYPTDPIWPIKEWAACWGPVFGMVVPAAGGAKSCADTLQTINRVTTRLDLLVKNSLLPEGLRAQIDQLHGLFKDQVVQAMPMVGRLIDQGIGEPTVGGTATFVARLMDSDITLSEVEREYAVDESGRQLPIYRQGSAEIRRALEADNLPIHADHSASYERMLDVAVVHNAVMLSKLTLLDGLGLNTLARSQGVGRTVYTGRPFMGKPVYRNSRRGGEVLMGAIRSIDGNHQWRAVAPDLPRNNYAANTIRITEQTCRRFGYPRLADYGQQGETYRADGRGTIKCANFERYDDYLRAARSTRDVGLEDNLGVKGGFRLWQDPELRQRLFVRLFKGPLSAGICNKVSNRPSLASQHGCDASDPYPASTQTMAASGKTSPSTGQRARVNPGKVVPERKSSANQAPKNNASANKTPQQKSTRRTPVEKTPSTR